MVAAAERGSVRPIIILGAGGHAKVLVDTLRRVGAEILGVTVRTGDLATAKPVLGVAVLGENDIVLRHDPSSILLVNAVGSVADLEPRRLLFEFFRGRGYRFASVVHPSAVIGDGVFINEGAQILAGAILQPGVAVGCNSIVNTGAIVDHDCVIGDHVHLAPGVALSGNVSIGAGSHVGTGARAIQGVRVGRNCLVGAGAVVVDDVEDGATVVGVPAKRRLK